MGKCKQTRKPLCTSTIFDLEGAAPRGYASSPNAWQTLKITDIHNSGPVVKNHTLSKTEGKYVATRTTACVWLFRTCPLDLLNLSGSPCLRRQHRNRRRHCKMSKSIAGTLHGRHAFHSLMSFSFMLSLHCALHPSRTPCHDVKMILRQVQHTHELGADAAEHWETSCEIRKKLQNKCVHSIWERRDPSKDLPKWLEEFIDNPVDREASASSKAKSGIRTAWHLYALAERPKLRGMQEDQNHERSVQKTIR